MRDPLGDRMKSYEAIETDRRLDPAKPVYARLDGRNFSKFTRVLDRPFDACMSAAMIETARRLINETDAKIAFVQSDEISLVWHMESDNPFSQMIFDGKVFKLTSVLAGLASTVFALQVSSSTKRAFADRVSLLPHFDCRVFNLPSKTEASNMLLWRERDATKNAVSMLAHHHFAHKDLQGVSTAEKRAMLSGIGIDIEMFPKAFRHGTFLRREKIERPLTEDEWLSIPQAFRCDRDALVTRTEIVEIDMPPFNEVTNRDDVIFSNAFPQTVTPAMSF